MMDYSFSCSRASVKRHLCMAWLVLSLLVVATDAGCASTTVATQTLPSTRAPTSTPIIPTITPTPNTTFDFEELISNLENTMPRPFSEEFVSPQKTDKIIFHIIALSLIDNHIEVPSELAAKDGYKIESLFDQGESLAESYVLVEQPSVERGWGLYLFRKSGARDIVVEAPHPVADENTSTVALDLYRALQAKALLVAGAHRDANADGSADPTHAVETIFQTIHTSLFNSTGQPDKKLIFIQVHGYSAEEHPEIPQVVIGYNWKNDSEKNFLLSKIVDALRQNNISVGVCNAKKYQGLCGTLNVQRQATEGGVFLHLELSKTLRMDDRGLVAALRTALTP